MPIQKEKVERYQLVGIRDITKRGGSLQLTIPPYVIDYLGLSPGEPMALYLDRKKKELYITKLGEMITESGIKFRREKGKWKLVKK